MPYINLNHLPDTLESYDLFLKMEDWCENNIPKDKWKFYYSPGVCVYGVDIPGKIYFKNTDDASTFSSIFK
jgi:hypothetical protein